MYDERRPRAARHSITSNGLPIGDTVTDRAFFLGGV